jgi:hypothetical protein
VNADASSIFQAKTYFNHDTIWKGTMGHALAPLRETMLTVIAATNFSTASANVNFTLD